jgi:hypothetical protein
MTLNDHFLFLLFLKVELLNQMFIEGVTFYNSRDAEVSLSFRRKRWVPFGPVEVMIALSNGYSNTSLYMYNKVNN